MSDTPLLEWKHNREVVKTAREAEREVLVIPFVEGHSIRLRYVKGKLELKEMSSTKRKILDENKLPTDLHQVQPTWGGFKIRELEIHCQLVGRKIIATHVSTPKGTYHSNVQTLHLLEKRGFITPMALSRWMVVADCKKPRHVERRLREHLAVVNQVIAGNRQSVWSEAPSQPKRFDWSFLKEVRQLLVTDPIGFVPTASSVQVQAVYKCGL